MRITSLLTGGLSAGLILLTLVLSGCGCGEVECSPCPFETLTLHFDLDSLQGGFRRAEVRSAYVVRYALNAYQQPLDTVRQRFNSGYLDFYATQALQPLYLFAVRPEATATTAYSYRVVVPAVGRQYDVTDVELVYEKGKGCCACERLTRRRFRLDGAYVNADAAHEAGVVLRR